MNEDTPVLGSNFYFELDSEDLISVKSLLVSLFLLCSSLVLVEGVGIFFLMLAICKFTKMINSEFYAVISYSKIIFLFLLALLTHRYL